MDKETKEELLKIYDLIIDIVANQRKILNLISTEKKEK